MPYIHTYEFSGLPAWSRFSIQIKVCFVFVCYDFIACDVYWLHTLPRVVQSSWQNIVGWHVFFWILQFYTYVCVLFPSIPFTVWSIDKTEILYDIFNFGPRYQFETTWLVFRQYSNVESSQMYFRMLKNVYV